MPRTPPLQDPQTLWNDFKFSFVGKRLQLGKRKRTREGGLCRLQKQRDLPPWSASPSSGQKGMVQSGPEGAKEAQVTVRPSTTEGITAWIPGQRRIRGPRWYLNVSWHKNCRRSFKDGVLQCTLALKPKSHTVVGLKAWVIAGLLSLLQERSALGPELVSQQMESQRHVPGPRLPRTVPGLGGCSLSR